MLNAPSRSTVATALRPWALAPEGNCQIATNGVENTNIFFNSRGARWVLRLHRTTRASVQREARLLDALATRALPVPRVQRDRRGHRVAHACGCPATVLSFIEGRELTRQALSVETARAIGHLVGRVDRALARLDPGTNAGTPPPHEVTSLTETRRRLVRIRRDSRATAPSWCAGVVVPWRLVEAALDRLEAPAIADLWKPLPRQLIHGDVSAQNVVLDARSGRAPALIDFGDTVVSARVADIAIAMAHLVVWRGQPRADLAAALWEGWSDVVSPFPAERLAVPSLVAARFVKLTVDHVWREVNGRHHPGHRALIAAGVEGLRLLAAGAVLFTAVPPFVVR